MELYRYLIDDFVIQYCQKLQKQDFIMKYEDFSSNRKGKREYLNDSMTQNLTKGLNEYFQTKVEIPRIGMGKEQEIETLINEEALLFAMYLRNERESGCPEPSACNLPFMHQRGLITTDLSYFSFHLRSLSHFRNASKALAMGRRKAASVRRNSIKVVQSNEVAIGLDTTEMSQVSTKCHETSVCPFP
jgi:hypothetical protein